ncbi:MAG: DUF899 family protein [Paenisporosarcina sp.]
MHNDKFVRKDGASVSLLDLFGDKDDLIVIQNMGKSCSYCTMWADGFNGVYHYLVHKAPFFLASPDPPEVQTTLAEERNWRFPMISTQNNTFNQDQGFFIDGQVYPGVSVFRKTHSGEIYLVANDYFDPGDDYSSPWHFFDLLPSGSVLTQMQFEYLLNKFPI